MNFATHWRRWLLALVHCKNCSAGVNPILNVFNGNNAQSLVETLHASSRHMLAVLDDVLEIDRMETGFDQTLPLSTPFSIRKLVHEVARMFTAMAHGADNVIRIRTPRVSMINRTALRNRFDRC